MYKSLGEDRYRQERRNPSFSSTLLDEIYRSIDDGGNELQDLLFYSHTMQKKPSRISRKQEELSGKRRPCLVQKWVEEKASERALVAKQRVQLFEKFERENHHDHDALLFSSTSISSESSSAGFSSSDTDSVYGKSSRGSCFPSSTIRPKPIRTSVSARSQKTECTLFYQQTEFQLLDDGNPKQEDGLIKSKSRAMKIYGNLKKVKQPISPGGRVASFINSLFSSGNNRRSSKSSSPSTMGRCDFDRSIEGRQGKSGQISTCSSASSFSRSCLSKKSPSRMEKLRNGVKRSVRFYPVSVILDEDCKPCGHKSLYKEEEDDVRVMSVSVPTAWKIGKSPSRKEEELKFQVKEKSRRVEKMARELLKDYHHHHPQKRNNMTISSSDRDNYEEEDDDDADDDDDDDDAASYSSSDLFELDHLSVIRNNRYDEELPVYETTRVDTNRAIASGLML